MTYRGTVKNGRIELEPGLHLPDGTVVQVEPMAPTVDAADGLTEDAVSTGIPDLASEHNHYSYGTPKDGQ